MPTRVQGRITPLKKRVLVSNMHFGMLKTKAGVILPDNDGTAAGTHPRWAKFMRLDLINKMLKLENGC